MQCRSSICVVFIQKYIILLLNCTIIANKYTYIHTITVGHCGIKRNLIQNDTEIGHVFDSVAPLDLGGRSNKIGGSPSTVVTDTTSENE